MSLSFATLGISSALTLSDDYKKTTISATKLLDIIETPQKVDRKQGNSPSEGVKGEINFQDVTFKCATAKTNAVEHLSFVINPGETVAFVDESGCGKSTTLQLIQRFIMEMPNNYRSEVQQTSLSGGQKQRICISRAILANTPILLLDEATTALDTESERLVQQSLENFRHGKTAILVAHRLATVINSDRILVFNEGRIAEEGTHKELIKKGGIYADLVKYQLQ